MVLSIAILLLFLLVLFKDFERGVIICIVTSTWLNTFSIGFFTSSLPAMIISVVFVVRYSRSLKKMNDYPLLFVSMCLLMSMVLTNYLAAKSHIPQLLSSFVTNVFMVYIVWVLFRHDSEGIFRIFLKSCVVYAIVIGINTMFEVLAGMNPYIDLCHSVDALVNDKTITEVRFGVKRAQGFFTMHTSLAGVAYHLFAVFLFGWYLQRKKGGKWIVLASLMAVTILLTGARSGMIALAISMMWLVLWNRIKFSSVLIVIALVAMGTVMFGNYFSEIFNSIVHSDDEAIGSSQGMRETQFELGFMYLFQSFWLGNGIGFIAEATEEAKDLLGAESMWLPLMIEYGIVGVSCYVLYYISCIKFVLSKMGGG